MYPNNIMVFTTAIRVHDVETELFKEDNFVVWGIKKDFAIVIDKLFFNINEI